MYFYIREAVRKSVTDPPVTLTGATLPFKEGKVVVHLIFADYTFLLPLTLHRVIPSP